ncbi:MAG: TrbI/VirB10 family protein [Sphingomonadaceae bacterium]
MRDTATEDPVDPRDAMDLEDTDLARRNSYPAVTQRKGASDGLGLAAGIIAIGALGAVTLWALQNPDTERNAQGIGGGQPDGQVSGIATGEPAQPIVQPPAAQPAEAAGPPAASPAPVYTATTSSVPTVQTAPIGNPYSSPTVVYDVGRAPGAAAAAEAADAAAAGAPSPPGGGSASDFASRIGGVGGAPTRAARSIDPSTTVAQGTLIPAVLETAINTDVPGYVRAVVSKDVRSFDGKRVLVPRGSRLVGQYQSGVQAGQKRAYVVWTRLLQPDGVSVDLASPGTGFDGTTGLAGDVDNKFFQRFGSAILLSVIGGLTAIAGGGASVVLGGGQSAAATALQQNGEIGPTIRVKQGEPIRVFTARDLDFSTVVTGR